MSVLPPIIAIALALTTKEVISSLLLGVLSGAIIFSKGNMIEAFMNTGSIMATKAGDNGSMLLFLSLLGCLVIAVTGAGCNHIAHVNTQLPYALTTAIASFIGFIAGGISNNPIIAFVAALIALAIMVIFLKNSAQKKYANS